MQSKYAFLFTSSVLFAGGIIVFFGLIPSPNDIGLPDPEEEERIEPVVEGKIN